MPFQLENGWEGEWNTTLSVGSQWRAEGQDHDLYSGANGALLGKSGGTGGSVDSGNSTTTRATASRPSPSSSPTCRCAIATWAAWSGSRAGTTKR
uniref:DUF1302 family protein n=1 Tax=Pseudomonas vranovensis TaxID=321661 RepID=UPI003EBA0D8C